jgi:glucose-6-phosphate 1-epimerase
MQSPWRQNWIADSESLVLRKFGEGNGGLPRVLISGSFGHGEIYLHGAQVTSWKPAGKD